MKNQPSFFAAILVGILLLGACGPQGQKHLVTKVVVDSSAFVLDGTTKQPHTIEVWYTDGQPDAVLGTLDQLMDTSYTGQLVLKARDGQEIVRLTSWANEPAAQRYVAAHPKSGNYKCVMAYLASYGTKEAANWVVTPTSSVQYSEFVMLRKSALDTLSGLVKAMTSAMAGSQPTLDYISTFNSTDSTAISLIGIWNTKEGFEVFEKQKTWGEKPYWEPYATNDHHMFDVLAATAKRSMQTYQ
jgi:hypothetical protein